MKQNTPYFCLQYYIMEKDMKSLKKGKTHTKSKNLIMRPVPSVSVLFYPLPPHLLLNATAQEKKKNKKKKRKYGKNNWKIKRRHIYWRPWSLIPICLRSRWWLAPLWLLICFSTKMCRHFCSCLHDHKKTHVVLSIAANTFSLPTKNVVTYYDYVCITFDDCLVIFAVVLCARQLSTAIS